MADVSPVSPRRVVAWTDGTAEALNAAAWAARHAVARGLPLHVLHLQASAVPAGPGRPGDPAAGREASAADVAELTREIRRIRARHRELPVTVEVAEDGPGRRGLAPLGAGDLLVTAPAGFRRLGTGDASARQPDLPSPVPVVVVPGQATVRSAARHVLLLTGPRLSAACAAFAFETAKDLGTELDVVRVAPEAGTYGDDYWIDPGRTGYLAESRLQADLSRLRARFPAVPGMFSTLRTRPEATLRSMARSAQLMVLASDTDREPLRLLEIGACPLALVPDL